jgi:sterol desaturase/sphingolipid hydroxylase (fatty acid hydroxylase superfamily)
MAPVPGWSRVAGNMFDKISVAMEAALAAYLGRIQGEIQVFAERLADASTYPFLVTPIHRLHWYYLFSFLAFAFVIYLRQRGADDAFTIKRFLRFWLPRSVYRHPSTLLDLKFYVFNGVFVELAFVTVLIGSFFGFAGTFEAALGSLWPGPAPRFAATPAAQAVYVIAIILAADLGFFVGHYLGHKVPLLWEFHKVHHSAPVLNPLTNYRFHPVDRILLGVFIGLSTALVKGGFAVAFPGGITEMTAINVGVLLLFNLTANLRHSHVWLSYGWRLSHVLSSPAQHQIHHGSEARHIDKNFGLMLSLWDWIAGTLYVPRKREQIALGLSDREHEEYDSLWRLYSLPFVKASALLSERRQPARAPRRLEGQEG